MSALLEVKHADISFGGIHAVKDLSFIVHAGEIVGLIGPNGSGKSTCVNLISGTYQLDAGEIWFDGKLIPKKMKAADRVPLGIGRTFQTPKPFGNMTVYDNILTCALRTRSFKEAHEKTRDRQPSRRPLYPTYCHRIPLLSLHRSWRRFRRCR